MQKTIKKRRKNPRYTWKEKLLVLVSMEFQIPRRQISHYFGVSRTSIYRWLRQMEISEMPTQQVPANKTPTDVARLIWEIATIDLKWGRVRIANQFAVLGVFISASTVRRVLKREKPDEPKPSISKQKHGKPNQRLIPAFYSNHVWSADLTTVLRWGLWPTDIFVAIDHFSRKVLIVQPAEGPNAGWVCLAFEDAVRRFGPPKHLITDQGAVFQGPSFAELTNHDDIRHRFGAVGEHGSIAVTERVIKSLKFEWLHCVILLKGFDHLVTLCHSFSIWHNEWRPHSALDGAPPDDFYARDIPEMPEREAKIVPINIERKLFKETCVTGFRLPKAA